MRRIVFCLLVVLGFAPRATATPVYHVELDTSSLSGHPAGPFSLAMALVDGSGTGDGNNIALLTNFTFGGGSPAGAPITTGAAFGDFTGGILLADATPFAFFSQTFAAGSTLEFDLLLTSNAEAAPVFDGFVLWLLDSSGFPLPTLAGAALDAFAVFTLQTGEVRLFAADVTRSPVAGGPPIDFNVRLVPEPSLAALLGLAAASVLLVRGRLTSSV